MLKIGDFANLFSVTIKTVRFYEEKELLKPCYVDKYSGYRYYDDVNIKQMSKIIYLKELGFSLEEIKNYDENLVKSKITEYEEKIMRYKTNINVLKDINLKSSMGEEVETFINDNDAIGKWNLVGVATTKENAKNHIFETGEYFDIQNLYLMENGKKYWIISWTKNVIYIKGRSNPYEIEENFMYVEILYPEDNSVYMVAVYEREDDKKYTIDEIRKKDYFNGYYKEDYKIIGFWKTVDFVKNGKRFYYRNINDSKKFGLEQIIVSPNENEVIVNLNQETKVVKYTKEYILDINMPDTKCKYEYKKINGKEYMFLEWKDEDYIFNNRIDGYYVLEKIGGIDYMDKMFEKKEKVYSILEKEGKGLTLGKDIVLPEDKRGNTNVLVIGGSGSGKSASYTVPNLLRMLGSYIVVDIYGEIYDKTHEYLKKNGYEIKVINYKNIKSREIDEEDRYDYNPLQYIKNEQDIEILSNILIGEEGDDEFWKEASKCLMKTVIYYVMEKEEKKDLLSCFKLLGESKEQLFEKFEGFSKNSKGAKYYSILKTFPEKTYQSVVSTAIMKLSFVINGIEEETDNTSDFDIMNIINEKVVVFIVVNENHNEERKLGSIFVSQFLNYYTFDKAENQHIYILLDEFDKFDKIYNMARNIEVARGRKLSISLITNNLEKVKSLYGNDFYSIINSIDTQVLLGTNVKEDLEYFSDLLGLDYEFIKNDLDKDKLLVAEKGLKAILAEKDYFFQHEEWI